MRATPSQELIDLLTRLELATAGDARRVYRRARWLAGDLTHFDSVWVDALAQVGRLTPFQAAELNAGRGESLRVGPFALLAPLFAPAWTRGFQTRTVGAAAARDAQLVRVENVSDTAAAAVRLKETIRRLSRCAIAQISPITECGAEGTTLWAASAPLAGRSASEWLVHGGRMRGEVVLEIARQMAIGLLALERAGVPHGDISTQNVVLDPIGVAQLTWPGLRGAVRPTETKEAADWPAEAYDHLAPERIGDQSPAGAAADLYSCGVVWRHLLSGRPPFGPARAAAKLCAAQTSRLEPIAHLAPDAPPALVAAITACESRDVGQRPVSAAALVELLGPSTDRGQALVAQYLSRGATSPERMARRIRTIRRSRQLPTWSAVVAGVIFALAVGTSPWWAGRMFDQVAQPPTNDPQVAQRSALQPQPITSSRSMASQTSGTSPSEIVSATTSSQPLPAQPKSQRTTANATDPAKARAIDPANRVEPASATLPVISTETPRGAAREFLLSAARPIPWSSVQPLAGQTVKGRPGERPTIVIPAAGAALAIEGVRFENIDFVATPGQSAGLLRVTARNASFEDCTFGGAAARQKAGVSLVWTPRAGEGSPVAPAELQFVGGAFTSAAAAISCTATDDSRLTLTDVLHLGSGPLVSVEHAAGRRTDAPPASLWLRLTHCTTRGAEALIELAASTTSASLPRVRVETMECVFAPGADGTLLLVRGGAHPADALRQVAWSGQGSVVTPAAHPVVWQAETGRQPVADSRLAIEGLVRSELGFAGEADAGRDASRLIRWQVPLRSPNPPGICEISERPTGKSLR